MITPICTKGFSKQERIAFLEGLLHPVDWSKNCLPMSWLKQTDFFTAPASAHHHGNYSGGLFDHCLNMTLVLVDLTYKEVIEPWQRSASPIIIGMLHDATKFNTYTLGEDGCYHNHREYACEYNHGFDSLARVTSVMNLTEEEAQCIRYHMGPYIKEDIASYSAAMKQYPNVLWTHTADMVASQLMED